MSACDPPPGSLFPACAVLKAQGIDVETHSHVLAVLVDAISRLEGGASALEAAFSDVEATETLLAEPADSDPTLLMTSEFLDAWRVGKD